jgi:hypothetical protein
MDMVFNFALLAATLIGFILYNCSITSTIFDPYYTHMDLKEQIQVQLVLTLVNCGGKRNFLYQLYRYIKNLLRCDAREFLVASVWQTKSLQYTSYLQGLGIARRRTW